MKYKCKCGKKFSKESDKVFIKCTCGRFAKAESKYTTAIQIPKNMRAVK